MSSSVNRSRKRGSKKINVLNPGQTTDNTEKLLDIDGLLEMTRLIKGIKQEGRLGGVDKKRKMRPEKDK